MVVSRLTEKFMLQIVNLSTFCIYCRVHIDNDSEIEVTLGYHNTCHVEFVQFNNNKIEHQREFKNLSKEDQINELREYLLRNFRCTRDLDMYSNHRD